VEAALRRIGPAQPPPSSQADAPQPPLVSRQHPTFITVIRRLPSQYFITLRFHMTIAHSGSETVTHLCRGTVAQSCLALELCMDTLHA